MRGKPHRLIAASAAGAFETKQKSQEMTPRRPHCLVAASAAGGAEVLEAARLLQHPVGRDLFHQLYRVLRTNN